MENTETTMTLEQVYESQHQGECKSLVAVLAILGLICVIAAVPMIRPFFGF